MADPAGDPVAVLTVPRAAAKLCRAAQTITVTGTHDRRGVMAATVVCLLAGCGGGGNASQTQTESGDEQSHRLRAAPFPEQSLFGRAVRHERGRDRCPETHASAERHGGHESRLVARRFPPGVRACAAHGSALDLDCQLRRNRPSEADSGLSAGRRHSHLPADDGWPKWSPDGKYIAFQRLRARFAERGDRERRQGDLQGRAHDHGCRRRPHSHSFLAGAVAG